MSMDRFERCLRITLKWEGGYSNHPDDPGGPTMRGIIQREYDRWRTQNGKSKRSVREITDDELNAIYRENYWDAVACAELEPGLDLCVFDAAVNSGVLRAQTWLAESRDIDGYCSARLAFLQRTGRLWRVFGRGWQNRVSGIRADAHRMTGTSNISAQTDDETLHAGMRGQAVRALQTKLRSLGYPCGAMDGIYGEQTYRAVVLFQHDNMLEGEAGVWQPAYNDVLTSAQPMLPKRQAATHRDLEQAGDKPIQRMNLMQRLLAWLFGASAAAQVCDGSSVVESMSGVQNLLEPVRGLSDWATGHKWMMVALLCVGLITLVRLLRARHVEAYRNFDYQGQGSATPSSSQTKANAEQPAAQQQSPSPSQPHTEGH